MNPHFTIVAAQAAPLAVGTPLTTFADDVARVIDAHPTAGMVVYPELHLFHTGETDDTARNAILEDTAVPLDGEFVAALGAIARAHGIWLVPGSIGERGTDGGLYNTALVFDPHGALVATYRKIFPWRPFEPHIPGTEFTVFDIDGVGRFGIDICYDAWFPEVSRSLAWMGADVILNIVKTTTPDRAQEVILARANSIVNQVVTVSVNTAGPVGYGQSLIVGPEGEILAEAAHTEQAEISIDFTQAMVDVVRDNGTAGTNRMWNQFAPTDAPIPLPIYGGHINPRTWTPVRTNNHNTKE